MTKQPKMRIIGVGVCNTCFSNIYEAEKKWQETNFLQCNWCYQEWQKELRNLAEREDQWKNVAWKVSLIGVLFGLLAGGLVSLINHEWEVALTIILIVIGGFIPNFAIRLYLHKRKNQPEVDRYRLRKKENNFGQE